MRVCESCGGRNISKQVYQDLNDGSIIEAATDDVHCWDCNDKTGDVDAAEYERRHAGDELSEEVEAGR